MKKSILLIAVFAGFSFASCKKAHNCVCTYNGVEVLNEEIKDTKKKAKDSCEEIEKKYAGSGPSCELK